MRQGVFSIRSCYHHMEKILKPKSSLMRSSVIIRPPGFVFPLTPLHATAGAYLSSRAPGCPAVPQHRGLSASDAECDTPLVASFRTRTFALVPRKETPELLKTARPLLWPYINFSFAPFCSRTGSAFRKGTVTASFGTARSGLYVCLLVSCIDFSNV